MKFFIIYLLLLLASTACAQQITAQQIIAAKTRPKGPFTEYVSKSGERFKVGDTLRLGPPSAGGSYMYLEEAPSHGDGMIRRLRTSVALKTTQIQYIRIDMSGRWGYYLQLKSSGPNENVHYLINLEQALQHGEIKTDQMAEDQALVTLRKAKEKLDLQLITQQQYDSIKNKMSQYIK